MPRGVLKGNRRKISGDASPEVFEELLRFKDQRDLPSLHRTTSVAIEEWFQNRKQSGQNPEQQKEGSP